MGDNKIYEIKNNSGVVNIGNDNFTINSTQNINNQELRQNSINLIKV